MEKKDYSYRGWLLVFATILAMGGLSFVPSFKVFGLTTEKMDILSELREKGEANEETVPVDYKPNFETLEQEIAEAAAEPADSLQSVAPVRYKWIVKADAQPKRQKYTSEQLKLEKNSHQMPIEDFDTTGSSNLDKFIKKLISGEDVRVAFLGDSFIEGDIITVDMREQLQNKFGGRGVGFVPCALPFEIYRPSVRRQATGWTAYSLLNQGNIPAAYKDRFFMSGYLAAGGSGATVRWQSTTTKPHLNPCSRARIFVTSKSASSVELTVNDTLKHNIKIAGAEYVRELYVEAPISSIKMRVTSGNILCHGASLEGGYGVMVDNLSIRGNSGYTIFGSSIATNTQIDKVMGYDLIVLEYGLNAMQPGQRNFAKYQQKLGEMIRYCKRCFPKAAILVLGVSDRAIKGEGGWHSINSVTYLGPVQRKAAKENGACFWDLGKVVMSYGGINGFVKNGWAAGDHIHINFKGGARIAESLAQAIQQRAYEMLLKREGKVLTVDLPSSFEPWKAYVENPSSSEEEFILHVAVPQDSRGDAASEYATHNVEQYHNDFFRGSTAKAEEAVAEEAKAEEATAEAAQPEEEPRADAEKPAEAKAEKPAEEPAAKEPAAKEAVAEAAVSEAPKAEAKAEAPAPAPAPAPAKVEEPKAAAPAVEAAPEPKPAAEAKPAVAEAEAKPAKEEMPAAPVTAVIKKTESTKTEEPQIQGPVINVVKSEATATETTNTETKQE